MYNILKQFLSPKIMYRATFLLLMYLKTGKQKIKTKTYLTMYFC